ncbi:MAG TPA: carboxypeptidase-like regulatory domain-containing protein, partial [Gemmataceae bacterium]|nr:carboxypeptidase-like regulatory domain-containing protein [Gemmataceae bacterium]
RFPLSTLFTAVGGLCSTNNNGDVVVLYDKLADRWILSQFAFAALNTPPYHECLAISKTPDPTGPYFAYDFITPGNEFPDYPKLGTWPDAYYMTSNQFFLGGGFDGAGVFAFDRAKMLVGDPTASLIYFNLCATAGNCSEVHPEGIFGMLPSDFDGLVPPPAGAPNVFIYPISVTFGDPADGLRLFDFTVGVPFGTGASFIERPESTYASPLPVAAWDLRNPPGRADITQPPPATGAANRLDAVASRIMHRLQYYNHGGTESLVSNITVNVSGLAPTTFANYLAAIRYFELQRSGGPLYSVHEQGTHAPDTDHRWMGSAAEDDSGDIALGYSVSSLTTNPSIRYAGRLPGDPPGTLAQTEQVLINGPSVQGDTGNRWGDYSAMQVDPVDYCTFWYTQEYYAVPSTFNWRTRVGNFRFPTCVSPPMGTLTGTVTYCSTGAPIQAAVISVSDGHSGATIANGTYSIALPPGTYTVSALDPDRNCAGSSSTSVVITAGGSAAASFCLTGQSKLDLGPVSIDDTAGNNNGIINRNECVKINAGLRNDGCLADSGISAVLSTSTPEVVIDQSFSTYPPLAIDASGGNATPFRIHTTPSFACGTPIDFTLTATSSFGPVRVLKFSLPTCAGGPSQSFAGTLVASDGLENSRLGRNAIASSCISAKGCPGPFDAVARHFDTFSFTNTSAAPACLTVTLDQSSCPGNLLAAAYLDSFDPTNICTNYLGDEGASPAVGSFAVNVPAGHNLIVAIQEVAAAGSLCPTGYSGTISGFIDNTDAGAAALNALSPAQVWIGLKNSDDVGTNFDLKAEVFRNGTLVGSGEVDNVSGGSSGFNNAKLRAISLALLSAGTNPICSGDTLSITLSVRAGATGHRSGTARLWYNDSAANSRFDATIGGTTTTFYLLDSFVLGTSAGVGPKKTIDVFVDRQAGGNPFKPFGTWSKTF